MIRVKALNFMPSGYDGTVLLQVSENGKTYYAYYQSIVEDEQPFVLDKETNAELCISCVHSVKKVNDASVSQINQRLERFTSEVVATVKVDKIIDANTIMASVSDLSESIEVFSIDLIGMHVKPGDMLEIEGCLDVDFDV